MDSLAKTWIWDFSAGGPVQEVRDLPAGGRERQVVEGQLVLDSGSGYLIGRIGADGRWTESAPRNAAALRPVFEQFALWSSTGDRVAYTAEGELMVFDELEGVTYPTGLLMGDVLLDLVFEDPGNVLAVVAADGTDPDPTRLVLVRFDVAVDVGQCERAYSGEGDVFLAR